MVQAHAGFSIGLEIWKVSQPGAVLGSVSARSLLIDFLRASQLTPSNLNCVPVPWRLFVRKFGPVSGYMPILKWV